MDAHPTYHIVKRKVRHARISVDPGLNVKLVIPLRYTRAHLELLLTEKRKWIDKQIAFFLKAREQAIRLDEGELLYLGQPRRVGTVAANNKTAEAWYRKEAKKYIFGRVAELAAEHGYSYARLFIRGSKTRWGSCSMKKNLSFNYRLIKAPAFVVDYLILHELAHTVVFNHSKKFWQRVADTCPDYKIAEKWLKDHGSTLH